MNVTEQKLAAAAEMDTLKKAEVAEQAAYIWNGSDLAGDRHAFLVLWSLKAAYGLRVYHGELAIDGVRCNGMLLMPMFDEARQLQNIAFLAIRGERRYLPGGRVDGLYYGWGSERRTIVISEGFRGAAAIHQALGHAVAVAFTAANVANVDRIMHKRHPASQIVLAADLKLGRQDACDTDILETDGMIDGTAEPPTLDPSQTKPLRAPAVVRQEATPEVQLNEIAALRPLQASIVDPVDPVSPTHLQDAEKLIDWALRKNLTAFTRKQVMQLGPNSLRAATTAKSVLLTLVQQGRLTTEDDRLYRVRSAIF